MTKKKVLYLGTDPTNYQTDGTITHYPLIKIAKRPFQDSSIQTALQQFSNYSHLLFTSKNSVKIWCHYMRQANICHLLWQKKTTIAIGTITAKHLELQNLTPTFIAKEETAEGVIHLLQTLPLTQAHIFWPHSAQARPVLANFFKQQTYHYTTCILYEPVACLPAFPIQLNTFDEIVFTSPSIVHAFFSHFTTLPTHIKLTAIGPITALALNAIN